MLFCTQPPWRTKEILNAYKYKLILDDASPETSWPGMFKANSITQTSLLATMDPYNGRSLPLNYYSQSRAVLAANTLKYIYSSTAVCDDLCSTFKACL